MTQKIIISMIEYFGKNVHQINHALKVYGFAGTICQSEKLSQESIDSVELATSVKRQTSRQTEMMVIKLN